MAVINSSVQICNLALSKISVSPTVVTDIETEPSTDIEVAFALMYDQSRRTCLRLHPWNFAIKRALLAASATPPLFEFSYLFPLPSDFVRVASIGTEGEITDYQLESDGLLINDLGFSSSSALALRYVYDIANVAKFDPLFIEVLASKLALDMVPQLSGLSNTAITRTQDFFDKWLRSACAVDGQDRPPRRRQTSGILNARKNLVGFRTGNQRYYS